MNSKSLIIILLLIFIALISIDILTGIWFWNRANLSFNPENFNNIATPILALIAIVIYGLALFTSIKQNRIIFGQTIQPYFLEEINKLKKKAKEKRFDSNKVIKGENVNLLNFTTHLSSTIVNLTRNVDFLNDYRDFENGIERDLEYFKERSYFELLMFIYEFTVGLEIKFIFIEIKELVQEINSSKLLEDNKRTLRKKIKKELNIREYIAFIEFYNDSSGRFAPLLPMIFEGVLRGNNKVIFKSISDTSLKEPYYWYKENLN